MKLSLRINMKMPTIFIFMAEKCTSSVMFSKKEFAIVSNLRFIRANFMFSSDEHEKYNLGASTTGLSTAMDKDGKLGYANSFR